MNEWAAGFSDIETEPMLLLDTTGSMNYETGENDDTPRRDTVREAISLIVERLAAEDSQAEHEEGGGGLRTVTFADGRAVDQGDLNAGNLAQRWQDIRWAGGTTIMPGWNALMEVYQDEFGATPPDQRPLLLALVITDGEALDTDAFAAAIAAATGVVYVVIALIGFGAEHDRALAAYQAIEQRSGHVKVVSYAGESNPIGIAETLLRMIS
jgi:hypothetical protein